MNFDNVHVVDSLGATLTQKLLVLYACQLVEKGLPAPQIIKELNAKKTKIRLYAAVDTLDYLKKGGRVSAAAATVGNILNLKPILSVIDGEVKMVSKAIGNRRANKAILDLVNSTNGINYDLPMGTLYAGDKENLVKFVSDCSKLFNDVDTIDECIIGPTIGTHVGPGAFGIAYFEK
jgi:DegV family protein with EDD domain